MGRIRRLSKDVAQNIAAGEVVERPASVVKELVENALDAEATRIEVCIAGGGFEKIVVRDNGWGMELEDLLLSTEPHCTSKIASFDDLARLESFGFRGEALAAIAAFSELTILTRAVGSLSGYQLTLNREKKEWEEKGAPVGTQITVRNLFEHYPGRRIVHRSQRTEKKKILQMVQLFAVASPKVYLSLRDEQGLLFQAAPMASLRTRGAPLFPNGGEGMIEVEGGSACKLEGLISDATRSFRHSGHIFFLVNGRQVRSPLLLSALKQGFSDCLPERTYPSALLMLRLPSDQVDVNIHPRKLEVAFAQEKEVFQEVSRVLRRALQREKQRAYATSWPVPDPTCPSGKVLAGDGESQACSGHFSEPSRAYEITSNRTAGRAQELPLVPSVRFPYRVLGQLFQTFILLEERDALTLVDQHALHERVLLERWKRERDLPYQPSQLLIPLTLTLSQTTALFLRERELWLESLGFQLSWLSATRAAVKAAPQVKGLVEERALQDFFEELSHSESPAKEENAQRVPFFLEEQAVKMLCCRQAVRAGDRLTEEAIEALLRELDNLMEVTPSIFHCAHGRPTVLQMTRSELYRLFQRT